MPKLAWIIQLATLHFHQTSIKKQKKSHLQSHNYDLTSRKQRKLDSCQSPNKQVPDEHLLEFDAPSLVKLHKILENWPIKLHKRILPRLPPKSPHQNWLITNSDQFLTIWVIHSRDFWSAISYFTTKNHTYIIHGHGRPPRVVTREVVVTHEVTFSSLPSSPEHHQILISEYIKPGLETAITKCNYMLKWVHSCVLARLYLDSLRQFCLFIGSICTSLSCLYSEYKMA